MLFFIYIVVDPSAAGFIFKYISCYSLSQNISDSKRRSEDLNTSHVILYRENLLLLLLYLSSFKYISCYSLSYYNKQDKKCHCVFKYISCYSLSIFPHTFNFLNKFKYISCYSLSLEFSKFLSASANLNTSHVILYHMITILFITLNANLNTSHVILYPSFSQENQLKIMI